MENLIKLKYEALERLITNHWVLSDKNVIRVLLAGVIAHYLDVDPLWIFIIAPPSSLKTELINGLKDLPDVYELSSLTPQTLFSGLKVGKKDDKPNSLLLRIGNKIITIKDFTTVLEMNREDRAIIFSQLREVYDGSFSHPYGNAVEIKWEGKIGLIAAVTTVIDRYASVYQVLGERFVQYRLLGSVEETATDKALLNMGKDNSIRTELREAFVNFFNCLEIPSSVSEITLPKEIKKSIISLAGLCVKARSSVMRDYQKRIEFVPIAEAPMRFAKQLAVLCYSLAILEGRKEINDADYLLTLKVGLDSIPSIKLKILNALSTGDNFKTSQVAEATEYSTDGITMQLEELTAHGIVTCKRGGQGIATEWWLSDLAKKYATRILPLKTKEILKSFGSKFNDIYAPFINFLLNVVCIEVEEKSNSDVTAIGNTFSTMVEESETTSQKKLPEESKTVGNITNEELLEIFPGSKITTTNYEH